MPGGQQPSRVPGAGAPNRTGATAAVRGRGGLDVDEESTRFFGRPSGRSGQSPTSVDQFDTAVMDGYDDFGSRYDVPGAFEPTDDFDREPTPALLAAKAEPLSDSPGSARRPNRKPTSPNRSKASEAARASKARAANRRKPKEPSKLLLGAGVVAILLAGFATAYFLTRGGDDGQNADLATESTDPSTDSTAAGTDSTVAGSDQTTGSSVAEPTGPPTVAFNEAALGPIEAGVAYTLGVQNAPPDATYQLLVDDVPVNEPAAELPPTTFEPGRHLLVINIDSPAGPTSTGPVLVYALGPTPEASLAGEPVVGQHRVRGLG